MDIKISGTPKEIKKLLDAIRGSREQLKILDEIKRNTEPLTGDYMSKTPSNQVVFDAVSNDFKKKLNSYVNDLLERFGSNKKARAFLKRQLFETADPDIHEFVKLVVSKLEQIALNQ